MTKKEKILCYLTEMWYAIRDDKDNKFKVKYKEKCWDALLKIRRLIDKYGE